VVAVVFNRLAPAALGVSKSSGKPSLSNKVAFDIV
jgi:hypothetical protein